MSLRRLRHPPRPRRRRPSNARSSAAGPASAPTLQGSGTRTSYTRCALVQRNPSHACALYVRLLNARPSPPRGQVRCCSNVKLSSAWGYTRSGCAVWGASNAGWSCKRDQTFAQAEAICQGVGARLCTAAELAAGCTTGTGCQFDFELVWGV